MPFKHRDIQLVYCEKCKNPRLQPLAVIVRTKKVRRHYMWCPELKEMG